MDGGKKLLLNSVFVLTVILLLLRPAIIFSSHTLSSILWSTEARTVAIGKIIKKKPEVLHVNNLIHNEEEHIEIENELLIFWLFAIRRFLKKNLYALSCLLSQFVFKIKRKATLFDIVPDNHYYLALSIIRI